MSRIVCMQLAALPHRRQKTDLSPPRRGTMRAAVGTQRISVEVLALYSINIPQLQNVREIEINDYSHQPRKNDEISICTSST